MNRAYQQWIAVFGVAAALTGHGAHAQTQNTTYTYEYDAEGNQTKVTDPRGQPTEQTYDVLGHVSTIKKPAPVAGGARPAITTSYDFRGNLRSLQDPLSHTTTLDVNGHGEAQAIVSPDTGKTTNVFDANGNLTSRTDARNITTTYRYDALNRLIREDYPGWSSTVFEYDGGTAGGATNVGQLTKMTDESGNTTFAYDTFGRLITKTQTVALGATNVVRTVSYSYGTTGAETGKLKTITYPTGNRIVYSYDTAGRLSSVVLNPVNANGSGTNTATSITLLRGITYNANGQVTGWTWGASTSANPSEYHRTYDIDGRITSYTLGNPLTTGATRTVAYDAASRITGYTHTGTNAASLNQTFGYDNLDRLVSVSGASNYKYSYDLNDNRLSMTAGASTYTLTIDANSNRLQKTTGPAPAKTNSYDAAGNLLTDGTVTYTYSPRGRLLTMANGGSQAIAVRYNGFGQRVQKGFNVVFVYDEEGHLISEDRQSNGQVNEVVYLGDIPVVALEQKISGTAPNQTYATWAYYIYTDHLNTPRVITQSSNGALRWRWDQADPFGLVPPTENPSGLGTFTFNLRMPGQYYDRESNLFYNYFRDYDPQLGRYVQSDPIGLRGGANTYGYVGANSASYVDSTGLVKQDPNSAYCHNLRQKIDNIKKDMDKRWKELAADEQGLPDYIGPGEKLYQTRRGHRTIINRSDRNLRDLERRFDDECGGPPPPAPVCEDEKKKPVPTWLKAVGAGAVVTGVAACAIAEPCGAILVGGTAIGGAVMAGGR